MAESYAYNLDCLEAMRKMPDNAFDLAVVDPPYGDASNTHTQADTDRGRMCDSRTEHGDMRSGGKWNRFGQRFDRYKYPSNRPPAQQPAPEREREVTRTGGTWAEKYGKKIIAWDTAPGKEYFDQLFRVSREQIIWGGNYFELPPTRCFLVWRKLTISESFTMAMAEYAWTSFNSNAKVFDFPPQGKRGDRFHPTQKPVELYAWIYGLYAKPGMKILDTHLGSGSSRIAAYDAGLDFVGYEIDKTYFDLQEERFAKHTAQKNLFVDGGIDETYAMPPLWGAGED